jgi:transcriptional regulator with XRE-family HTH domain
MITSEQIRGARAMLRIEQSDLAARAGVSLETIKRIERSPGEVSAMAATVEKIRRALEDSGVEFTNGDRAGVRWRGWKWHIKMHDADSVRPRWVQYYPDFESTLAAATEVMAKRKPSERPVVHVPAEGTDAQRAAFRSLGLQPMWP